MYILDNHMHLQFKGKNVEAVREFEKQGGTHAVLVRYPVKIGKADDFERSYEDTLRMAEHVQKGSGVKVFVAVGPYPAEILHLEKVHGLEKAVEAMKKGVDFAAEFVKEQRALAIGEVGRPHFPVEEKVMTASNEIMEYAMAAAKDAGCPIVLHTESANLETYGELAAMADRVGLERWKVIKHFSPPIVDEERNSGLFPSIIGSEKNLREALNQGTRFMLESDYLDDMRRPGAVIPPATIAKKTKKLIGMGAMSEDDAFKIHKENPERVYGIEFE
jgi:TatD-related deoxyribonuclease